MPTYTMQQIADSLDADSRAHFTEDALRMTLKECAAHWSAGDGHSPRFYLGIPASRQVASHRGMNELYFFLRDKALNTVHKPAHLTCDAATASGTCGKPATHADVGCYLCDEHYQEAE